MKTINKIFMGVFAFTLLAFNANADDNEVLLDQTGDNLVLTILQAGYGNTLSGDSTQ